MKRLMLLMCLCGPATSLGQDEPIARITITPETIAVGEAAEMRVTVLVPTWFPSPPEFPSFEVPNAIVRLPPDSSRAMSERIARQNWSGITRRYSVYPLMSASYRLGGDSIGVTYANPGADPIEARIELPEISLQASVPAGAESLEPYISGTRFDLRRELEPDLDEFEVGDALVITYVAELEGLPAIFVPPIAPPLSTAGVSVYADEPLIDEGPPATRIEKLTLVFEAGAELVLPAVELDWWNTATGAIETATIDSLPIQILGPVVAEQLTAQEQPTDWRMTAGVILLAVCVLLLLRRYGTRIQNYVRVELKAYIESEKYAFKKLQQSLRRQDAAATYRALVNWHEHHDTDAELRDFLISFGDSELSRNFDALDSTLYGKSTTEIDYQRLEHRLVAARNSLTAHHKVGLADDIPPLNP